MVTKQYTITERNSWERETFGYVMDLTADQASQISDKIKAVSSLKIEQTDYTDDEIAEVNDNSQNNYKDRLARYVFKSETAIEEWVEHPEGPFYKGCGLLKVEIPLTPKELERLNQIADLIDEGKL